MELDAQVCYKRNIHNRSLSDIEDIVSRFARTPAHQIQLEPTTLLQSAAIPDVHMEDAEPSPDLDPQHPQHPQPEVRWRHPERNTLRLCSG